MRARAMAAAAGLLMAPICQARDFDLGTVELSGSGSYLRFGDADITQSNLVLQPSIAVYLNRYYDVGPLFSWERQDYKETSVGPAGPETGTQTKSFYGLGAKAGGLLNLPDWPGFFLPFLDIGGGAELAQQEESGTVGEGRTSSQGWFVLANAGIKFRLSESFLLSVFVGGSHHSFFAVKDQLSAGFGFSGLLGWGGSKGPESPLGRPLRRYRS